MQIIQEIEHSKSSIQIFMSSFVQEDFINVLDKKYQQGLDVTVILKNNAEVSKHLSSSFLESINQLPKEHSTLAFNDFVIIDNSLVIVSINYTKGRFAFIDDNTLILKDDYQSLKRFTDEFRGLKQILNEDSDDYDIGKVIQERVKAFEKRDKLNNNLKGIPTGFLDLDFLSGGWQKSDLTILASQPNAGKSSWLLSSIRNTVSDFDFKAAIFSLELSKVNLITRLFALECEINLAKLLKGSINNQELEHLKYRTNLLRDTPLFIQEAHKINLSQLRSKIQYLKRTEKIDLVAIDYLQLIQAKYFHQDITEFEILKGLKSLAREFNLPIIALYQFSPQKDAASQSQGNSYFLPEIEMLVNSSYVDTLLVLKDSWETLPEMHLEREQKTQLNIIKNAGNKLGTVTLDFIPAYGKFLSSDKGRLYKNTPEQLPKNIQTDKDVRKLKNVG